MSDNKQAESEGQRAEGKGQRAEGKGKDSLADLFVSGISLDAIIKGFPTYLRILLEITLERSEFVRHRYGQGIFLKNGILFLTYSVFISYILLIPAFLASDTEIGKWAYLLRTLFLYIYFGLFLQLAFRSLRGKGKAGKTLGAYFYLCGTYLNLHILIFYPVLVKYGPEIMLSGELPADFNSLDPLFLICSLLVWMLSLLLLRVSLSWFSQIQKIGKWRVISTLVLASIPVSISYLFIVVPTATKIGNLLESFMGFL